MKRTALVACVGLLLLIAALGSGCRRVELVDAGVVKTDEAEIALEGADESRVRIEMGVGELSVTGDDLGKDALHADFEYEPADLRPEVDSDISGDRLEVEIRQGETQGVWLGNWGSVRNVWDIVVAQDVPTELDVEFGAGESDLDLTGVDVRKLDMEMGAGDVTVDLSGERTEDVEASIVAGAGEVTLRVPEDVGVRITGIQDGLGDWDAPGFSESSSNAIVNDAWEDSDVHIEVDLQRGVGDVNVELVD